MNSKLKKNRAARAEIPHTALYTVLSHLNDRSFSTEKSNPKLFRRSFWTNHLSGKRFSFPSRSFWVDHFTDHFTGRFFCRPSIILLGSFPHKTVVHFCFCCDVRNVHAILSRWLLEWLSETRNHTIVCRLTRWLITTHCSRKNIMEVRRGTVRAQRMGAFPWHVAVITTQFKRKEIIEVQLWMDPLSQYEWYKMHFGCSSLQLARRGLENTL